MTTRGTALNGNILCTTCGGVGTGCICDITAPVLTSTQARRRVVFAPAGRTTHRPVEVQGNAVLTGCGMVLEGYSEDTEADAPTCKRCARRI
jgi:hypothetical protein